jgi:pimeloyl-ACP methyl ester carboxylesterase
MNGFSQTLLKAEVVNLNGSNIYYEVYGKGEPLFLLHAYTASSKSWLEYVSDYTDDYKVYLVDLKGHGKSGLFTEDISIKSAAGDLAELIKYLKLDSINAIGYSYGGEVLFQLALQQPGLIKSMVVSQAVTNHFVTEDSTTNVQFLHMMYQLLKLNDHY